MPQSAALPPIGCETRPLERSSGDSDKPRMLEAFNEPIEDWLDFFMFAMFTDRDGKSQLMSLAESALDPLSRTTRANGLKGRAREDSHEEHRALHRTYQVPLLENGEWTTRSVPLRSAMNEVLRDWYIGDCEKGIERWNKLLERQGISDRLYVPSRRFNRKIGIHAGKPFDPAGHLLPQAEWDARRHEWLPSPADKAYLESIMARPVFEVGKFANWIAPPLRGINRMPVEFEYVRTEA